MTNEGNMNHSFNENSTNAYTLMTNEGNMNHSFNENSTNAC